MSSILNADPEVNPTSRLRLAAAVIFVALAAMPFAARDAAAQIVSAQPGAPISTRTPYQVYLTPDCPASGNFCKFVSPDVPAGQLLEIQRVACQGWHANTTPPNFVVMAELRNSADLLLQRIDLPEHDLSDGGHQHRVVHQRADAHVHP